MKNTGFSAPAATATIDNPVAFLEGRKDAISGYIPAANACDDYKRGWCRGAELAEKRLNRDESPEYLAARARLAGSVS